MNDDHNRLDLASFSDDAVMIPERSASACIKPQQQVVSKRRGPYMSDGESETTGTGERSQDCTQLMMRGDNRNRARE